MLLGKLSIDAENPIMQALKFEEFSGINSQAGQGEVSGDTASQSC
jgi:hypothetical protein